MKKYLLLTLIAGLGMFHPQRSFAQEPSQHDTGYYERYPGSLVGRIYFVQKYAGLKFPSADGSSDFDYKLNSKTGIGLGATYHYFSLNVAVGLGSNNSDKGKTKGFGLQLHLFPHKWAADLVTAFNTGCYIDPKGYASPDFTSYYYRPDVKFNFGGLSLYRVPNADKFSYHAALTQNEWQKKSAGSLLFGGQTYFFKMKGDSSLVPKSVQGSFSQSNAKDIHVFGVGPGIGYAYTFVFAKRMFIMGSLVGNVNVNFSGESGESDGSKVSRTSVNPGAVYKAAAGYNGVSWNISAQWTGLTANFPSASSEDNFYLPAGNFRFIIAKRFMLKKHGT